MDIRVVNLIENEDGSADVEIEFDEEAYILFEEGARREGLSLREYTINVIREHLNAVINNERELGSDK